MKKQEIKTYFNKLGAFQKRDFYNSIACRFGSSDDMVHLNNSEFFETQFLNEEDAEQSKIDNSYNKEHTYVRMLEYKKLETSNNLLSLINQKELAEVVFENIVEVIEIGIIENNINKSEINDFNSKSIHTYQQDGESSKNVNTVRLKRQFDGKGEVKGYRFNQIARNDYAVIYEKVYRNFLKKSYEVFELRVNTQFNIESYPKAKSFGYWAFEIDTLEKAVHKFHELSKREKKERADQYART